MTALVIRGLAFVSLYHLDAFQVKMGDRALVHYFAARMVQGPVVEPLNVNLPPVFLGFLAFCYRLAGPGASLPVLVQLVLGSLTCVVIYHIGSLVWDRKVGIVAGMMAAFHGILIFYDNYLWKTSMQSFWLMLGLCFCFMARRKVSPWRETALAAVSFAMAFLLRRQLAAVLPGLVLWMILVLRPRGRRQALQLTAVFLALFGATLWGWQQWYASVLPMQKAAMSEWGVHFYVGNQAQAQGTYKKVQGIRASALGHSVDGRRLAETAEGHSLTASEVNRYWLGRGIDEIRRDVPGWSRLELKKLFLIFNKYEIPNDENYDFIRKKSWLLSLPLISFGLIAPLGLTGMMMSIRTKNPDVMLLVLCVLGYTASLLLFFVTAGYRMPLQPLLLLFAAFFVCRVVELLQQGGRRTLSLAAVLFAVLYAFTNHETFLNPQGYDSYYAKRVERALKARDSWEVPSARTVKKSLFSERRFPETPS